MTIKLNIGRIDDAQSRETTTHELNEMTEESRWRKGYALLGDSPTFYQVEKRTSLGEVEYRFKGSLIDPKSVTTWNHCEYMHWRDE